MSLSKVNVPIFSEQSISAQLLLLPQLIGNSKQIFYRINQSICVTISSPNYSTLILPHCFWIF